MIIDGLSPVGSPRQLDVRDEENAPAGERSIVVTIIVAGTPSHTVTVPAAPLRDALRTLDLDNR